MAFAQQSIAVHSALLSMWMFGGISDTAPPTTRGALGLHCVHRPVASVALQGSTPPPLACFQCGWATPRNLGGANFDSAAYSDITRTARRQVSGSHEHRRLAPTARAYHAGLHVCLSVKNLVFGGETASGTLLSDTVQLIDPTGTGVAWSPPRHGPIPRRVAAHPAHSNGSSTVGGRHGHQDERLLPTRCLHSGVDLPGDVGRRTNGSRRAHCDDPRREALHLRRRRQLRSPQRCPHPRPGFAALEARARCRRTQPGASVGARGRADQPAVLHVRRAVGHLRAPL